ncbi:hypothetical protein N0V90_013033 [Kalmusia sp. IMI 367209]|nr:hypothetical protein N0V90_013033 [Kalmusia sp. IMI 367209]
MSFAVPKGLPGNPNSKSLSRMAIETRVHNLWNHLIESASARTGSLLIWDTGTYTVLPRKNSSKRPSSPQTTDNDSDTDLEVHGPSKTCSTRTGNEKLIDAFQTRYIRLRLNGARLPKNYTITLRLPSANDIAKPGQGRRRGQRKSKPTCAPQSTDSESEDDAARKTIPDDEEAPQEIDTDSDEDAQTRVNNAYPGSTNSIGSVHQRNWFMLLDRAKMRLSPTRLLCAAILLCIFFLLSFITKLLFGRRGFEILPERPRPARPRPLAVEVPYGEECAPFRAGAMDDVTIVLKIGAGEVATLLPAYLSRLNRCKQDVLLFSDRKDAYGGFDIVDTLANLRPEYKYNNPDFDVYDQIQKAVTVEEKTKEGWRLDKYKFLPMIELADSLRPRSNWFLFVELDTYVNWDNMQRFLATFDPKTPYYFGSPVWPRKKTVFAHGGSGFVLSRGAFNKLMARGRMFAENHRSPGTHLFGKDVRKECCGDEVLAKVLKESGISIRGYWPMFNGESPSTVRFNWEQWCEAVLTLHHMQPDEFASLERWESSRERPSKPLTFEELFTYIEPFLQERRDDWSNVSEEITYQGKKTAGKSADACRAACSRVGKCMQWQHYGETCRLSRSIRLGHEQASGGGVKWTSGWMLTRIQSFKAKHSQCHGAHFVHANP